MKDKKKITAALSGITSALRKGYDLINSENHLPQVENSDLAAISGHIVKALNQQLHEIADEEQFAGLTYEEMVEKKQQIRSEQIQQLQDKAGEDLKKLKGIEVSEQIEDSESDGSEPNRDETVQNTTKTEE